MAKADLLNILYSKNKTALEFKWDSLWLPSMYNYLTVQDIQQLNYIATSVKYASKIEEKYKAIDDILKNRGFRKFHSGTNRIVYAYLEDTSFLIKVALDRVGMRDNPDEMSSSYKLKPFLPKVFEVSPCGTVATVERVEPITSREEFASVAEEIFDLINNCFIGKYVLEDFGTKYFMNWGIRRGFGPVLLDAPYVYELDGNKLFCNKIDPITKIPCNGTIDYDNGFNNLVCTSCGKRYFAHELEQSIKDKIILLKEEGEIEVKISLRRGRDVVKTFYSNDESDYIVRKGKNNKRTDEPTVKVSLTRNDNTIEDNLSNETIQEMNSVKVSLSRPSNNETNVNIPLVKTSYSKEDTTIEKVTETVKSSVVERMELGHEHKSTLTCKTTEVEVKSNFIPNGEDKKEETVELTESLLSGLGLSDADFEEPNYEDYDEEESDVETTEENEEESEFSEYEEEDNFQKFSKKKPSNKFMEDNF